MRLTMRNIKYGICKSNSMDFNCCSSNNRYENYRISMVLMGCLLYTSSRTGLINKDSKKRKISTALNQKKSVEKALRPVALLDDENNILSIFRSIKIAGEITNIPQQNIGEDVYKRQALSLLQ